MLRIANDVTAGVAMAPFLARLMTEHAAALGGYTRLDDTRIVTVVNIPQ